MDYTFVNAFTAKHLHSVHSLNNDAQNPEVGVQHCLKNKVKFFITFRFWACSITCNSIQNADEIHTEQYKYVSLLIFS